jgi:putative PIN family toxin of toxin-antitoxin system
VNGSAAGPEVRLFLDANIIVSGIAFSGAESDLLLLAEQGVYEAVTSEYVIAQVERVLLGKLRLSEPLVRAAMAALPVRVVGEPEAGLVEQAETVLRDPTDAPVLAAALSADVEGLVTGDKDLHELEGSAPLRVLRTGDAIETVQAARERDSE